MSEKPTSPHMEHTVLDIEIIAEASRGSGGRKKKWQCEEESIDVDWGAKTKEKEL